VASLVRVAAPASTIHFAPRSPHRNVESSCGIASPPPRPLSAPCCFRDGVSSSRNNSFTAPATEMEHGSGERSRFNCRRAIGEARCKKRAGRSAIFQMEIALNPAQPRITNEQWDLPGGKERERERERKTVKPPLCRSPRSGN